MSKKIINVVVGKEKESVLVSGQIEDVISRQEYCTRFLENFSLDFESANKEVNIVLPINNTNVNFIFLKKIEAEGMVVFAYAGLFSDGEDEVGVSLMYINLMYDANRELTVSIILTPDSFEVNP